jgi:hypothetical protein
MTALASRDAPRHALDAETLADMLVFGGFTTRDAADGFGPAPTQTKIAYLAELISRYFTEPRAREVVR